MSACVSVVQLNCMSDSSSHNMHINPFITDLFNRSGTHPHALHHGPAALFVAQSVYRASPLQLTVLMMAKLLGWKR